MSNSGFLSGFLGIQGQTARLYKLPPLTKQFTMNEMLNNVRFEWRTETTFVLYREDNSQYKAEA